MLLGEMVTTGIGNHMISGMGARRVFLGGFGAKICTPNPVGMAWCAKTPVRMFSAHTTGPLAWGRQHGWGKHYRIDAAARSASGLLEGRPAFFVYPVTVRLRAFR